MRTRVAVVIAAVLGLGLIHHATAAPPEALFAERDVATHVACRVGTCALVQGFPVLGQLLLVGQRWESAGLERYVETEDVILGRADAHGRLVPVAALRQWEREVTDPGTVFILMRRAVITAQETLCIETVRTCQDGRGRVGMWTREVSAFIYDPKADRLLPASVKVCPARGYAPLVILPVADSEPRARLWRVNARPRLARVAACMVE